MPEPPALLLMTYRNVSTLTHVSVVNLLNDHPDWLVDCIDKGPVSRARSFVVSKWYKEHPESPAFLMVDDDVTFRVKDAERLVKQVTSHDIIGAIPPFRDARSAAVRGLGPGDVVGSGHITEVRHLGAGFFAVNRRVIQRMTEVLPEIEARRPWSFWPFFLDTIVEDPEAGCNNWLTEDYAFCEKARELGFKVWADPWILINHLGVVPVNLANMGLVEQAFTRV